MLTLKKLKNGINSLIRRHPNASVSVFYSTCIIVYYHKVFFGYFEGDEWYYFSKFMPLTPNWYGIFQALYKSVFDAEAISGGGHLTPVYNGLWFLYNQIAGVNYYPYIISSVVLHCLNSFLVYKVAYRLANNRLVGFCAGLFFSLSAAHFQAISWVMNFIPTQLSVTFFLCSLIAVIVYAQNYQPDQHHKMSLVWINIFVVLALFTKESTVILFALIPVIIFMVNHKALTKRFNLNFVSLIFCYAIYRALLPQLIKLMHSSTSGTPVIAIDYSLYFFRAVTYPVKMLAEVFIPWRWILNSTEFLTPLAYPYFAAEQKVRGTNFLMFTQTAGSDILIYVAGTILVCIIIQNFQRIWAARKLPAESKLYIVGVGTIVLSAFPLLFIALYAPGWAYVTFLDSRHLYLGSIGAALIVGYYLNKLHIIKPKIANTLLIFIIIIWGIAQFFTLQNELQTFVEMGQSRRSVLDTILRDVPKIPNQVAFLVSSDTGYYGFGPIPPFQTNLGQILMIHYFVRQQLSADFLHDPYFGKATLNTQQMLTYDKNKFGYYVSITDFVIAAIDHSLPLEHIYAFKWVGKKNNLTNISPEVREKVIEKKKVLSVYQNWKSYKMKNLPLTIQAPPDAQFTEVSDLPANMNDAVKINTLTNNFEVRVHTSTVNIGLFEDLSYLPDSTGKLLGYRNYVKAILSQYSDPLTTKISTDGPNMNYYIPIIIPNKIVELVVYDEPSADTKVFAPAEELISLMRYQPDKKE